MRKLAAPVLLVALIYFSAGASAFDIENENVKVYLNSSSVTSNLSISGFDSDKITYVTSYRSEEATATIEGSKVSCSIVQLKIGSQISCPVQNQSGKLNVFLDISADDLKERAPGKYEIFRFSKTFARTTEKFSLRVYLEPASRLADPENLSLERIAPTEDEIGSDGRSIYVEWSLKPELGQTETFQAVSVSIRDQGPRLNELLVLGVLIILFSLAAVYTYKYRDPEPDPDLSEDEREVYDIVNGSESGVLQKSVVEETGYSKAKISEVVEQLTERGLVEKTKEGRTNRLIAE